MNRELICYILKSYLLPIGNIMRKQPQRTNRYAVVSERALGILCTSIIYTARGGFSYIVKHSCTSGGHLLCIGIVLLMYREVICYILKSYLPPIGNTVRKQPCKGWPVGRAGLASETSLPCLSGTHS